MDIEIETTARAFAIKYGAITLGELIEWADSQIQIDVRPYPNIIDLSLAKTMGEALSALNKFDKPKERGATARLTFRLFHQALCSGVGSYHRIAKALYYMAMDGFVPKPEIEGEMMSFWDKLDLASDGVFGMPDQVKKEMLEFLNENKG